MQRWGGKIFLDLKLGSESLHDTSIINVVRVINFATSKI
jgi:hypothetical protein